ncbi:uncharacterized protein [Oscarella lobularis]|uniref:uncharacterized protein isoform X2 n=1 Tax=Oscarella lobularis TaxID=121494 RepID=UPI0033143EC7
MNPKRLIAGLRMQDKRSKRSHTEMAPLLSPKEGDKVLDIGSGTGGMAIHLAKVYGADVRGLDVSADAIKVGRKRAASTDLGKGRVTFDEGDAMQTVISDDTYDFVVLRSCLMHIPFESKYALLEKTFKWLKPGGRLLLDDMHAIVHHSDVALQRHMKNRHWYLLPLEKIVQYLKDVGYKVVSLKDRGDEYVDFIRKKLAEFEGKKEELAKDEMLKDILDETHTHKRWKMKWAEKKAFGEHYVLAQKPVM